jgi:hypothetical protein
MKRGGNKKTRHHIIPRSRGGHSERDNISLLPRNIHQKYHSLFDNKTPPEILDFLVSYFWKGNKQFIREYLDATRGDYECHRDADDRFVPTFLRTDSEEV